MRHSRAKRDQAIQLRSTDRLSLNELAEKLGISRSTVRYWVKDITTPELTEERSAVRAQRQSVAQQAGTAAMQAKYAAIRQEAYIGTYDNATELLRDSSVRDFVVLYLAEGYRKQRNCVAVSNSNPNIVKFAHDVMFRLATNKRFYLTLA